MDYRYIDAFIAVAEENSFSLAGKKLNIAQPAVSRKIQLFEDSLKSQLFFRSSRKVKLTPIGEELYRHLKESSDWILNRFYNHEPEVRIGASQGVLEGWISNKLSSVAREHLPHRIALYNMSNDEIHQGLIAGRLDLGFTHTKLASDNFVNTKLYVEKYCLISKKPVDLKQLHTYPWITGFSANYLQELAKGKISERIIKTSSISLMLKLVEYGHGIAVVPADLIPSDAKIRRTLDLPIKNGEAFLISVRYENRPQYLENFVKLFC